MKNIYAVFSSFTDVPDQFLLIILVHLGVQISGSDVTLCYRYQENRTQCNHKMFASARKYDIDSSCVKIVAKCINTKH